MIIIQKLSDIGVFDFDTEGEKDPAKLRDLIKAIGSVTRDSDGRPVADRTLQELWTCSIWSHFGIADALERLNLNAHMGDFKSPQFVDAKSFALDPQGQRVLL